jgi:T-complex protein 1 subunit alpha
MYQQERNPNLFLGGERTSGQDVRSANGMFCIQKCVSVDLACWLLDHVFFCSFLVLAAVSIANIVKSSLGPVGLDKMLVDEIGVSIYTWLLFVLVTASL